VVIKFKNLEMETYISNVNFIFWSKSPMKMIVKFLMNRISVTNSSFFFASRPFFVYDGDIGEHGEADDPPAEPGSLTLL